MQIDFHYNTIRVLMEKTGFSPEDAQIIAYASQYIDDAVDHKIMKVNGHLEILSRRFSGKTFNPVCTAHRGVQFVQGFKEDVQNKIYIPFHFLPDLELIKTKKDSYIVTPNGKLARKLVYLAKTELSKSTGEQRVMNLIRLGISLHVYADTWAHQNFSGRHKPTENDIDNIEIFKEGKWEKISRFSQLEYNTLPDIGHAEAASFPDQSYLKWKYKKLSTGKIHERDNTQLFIEAAKNIFNLFTGIQSDINWNDIKVKLHECFSFNADSVNDKFKKFQTVFPEIGFFYDETQWREEALQVADSSKLIKILKEENQSYILGSDKKWFYFHLAALEQREYILNLIKKIT